MLQMPNVMPDQADTYKCFAVNEYGQAVVTVVLNVIEGEEPLQNKVYKCIIIVNIFILEEEEVSAWKWRLKSVKDFQLVSSISIPTVGFNKNKAAQQPTEVNDVNFKKVLKRKR